MAAVEAEIALARGCGELAAVIALGGSVERNLLLGTIEGTSPFITRGFNPRDSREELRAQGGAPPIIAAREDLFLLPSRRLFDFRFIIGI